MTPEEVEEALERLQSKPGVLGTLVVTGSLVAFTRVRECTAHEFLAVLMSGVSYSTNCLFFIYRIAYVTVTIMVLTAEGKVLKTSLAPKMLEQV